VRLADTIDCREVKGDFGHFRLPSGPVHPSCALNMAWGVVGRNRIDRIGGIRGTQPDRHGLILQSMSATHVVLMQQVG
jgi:hypothetical protein